MYALVELVLTIRYNILNLPDTIQFKYGNQIINRYAASRWLSGGRNLYTEYFTKLIQLSTPIGADTVYSWVYNRSLYNLKGNDYVGNMEYSSAVNTAGTKTHTLLRVHNPEGYSNNFNNSYSSTWFFYFRRDHLGNTREVWEAPFIVYAYGNRTDPASVMQRTQYYPSGLPWSEGLASDWQPYKYNGKEFVEMNGWDETDLGWRGLQNATMRFNTLDPLAELKYSISPYAFCGNNPINRIDPDGRWFDDKNEKKAHNSEEKIDKQSAKLEKQIAKLEKKGKDVGDRKERIGELKKSKTDIADMRGNKDTEFKYASANDKSNPAGVGKPTTTSTGENQVTMFTENTTGSNLHEGRHGGDISRGTLTNSTYGVQDEISAYKAQYSFDGKFSYVPFTDFSNQANIMKLTGGIQSFQITLTNINQFTPGVVNSMVDKAGLMQVPIYPPTGVSIEQWNNN